MYQATVEVTLRKSILDPKGKAAHQALQNLGLNEIKDVRIGKLIKLKVDASSDDEATQKVEDACNQLLANEVMEDFSITLDKQQE